MCAFVCACAHACVCVYLCVSVCVYLCVSVCVYLCVRAWVSGLSLHEGLTHVHEQGQAGDPLHGQDEEGEHGQVPAVGVALDAGQDLLEHGAGGAAETQWVGTLGHMTSYTTLWC